MIAEARQARKFAATCGLLLATTALFCATAMAQQQTSYQIIAPDIVPQNEVFTIRVVQNTDAGQVPLQAGTQISVNENLLSTEDGGKVRVPAWTTEIGNQFLIVEIPQGGEQIPPISPIPHHIEVVQLP